MKTTMTMTRSGFKLGLAVLSVWATLAGWSALARTEPESTPVVAPLAPPPTVAPTASPAAAARLATQPRATGGVQSAAPTRLPRAVARTRSSR
jgi:hypothetical protein